MGLLGGMMAKWEMTGAADQYVQLLEQLGMKTPEMIGRAIYPAAGLVTDQIRKNIQTIPVITDGRRGTPSNPIDGITSAQRTGLADGLGITHLEDKNGYISVKVGFSGYNSQVSTTAVNAKWTNKRQPNAMIARSVESGNSFRKKHPFIAPAVSKTKKTAEERIKVEIEAEIKKLGF